MEKEEFARLVKGLKESYPNFKMIESKEGFEMWYAMLKDIPYPAVSRSVCRYIATNKYPPSIADIRQGIAEETQGGIHRDWSSGWSLVLRSLSLYGYYRGEEALEWIAKQDPTAAAVAKRLRYQDICMSENISVERANFRMAYEQLQEQIKYTSMLPDHLQLSQGMDYLSLLRPKEDIP